MQTLPGLVQVQTKDWFKGWTVSPVVPREGGESGQTNP
jgi:hypothetical protein